MFFVTQSGLGVLLEGIHCFEFLILNLLCHTRTFPPLGSPSQNDVTTLTKPTNPDPPPASAGMIVFMVFTLIHEQVYRIVWFPTFDTDDNKYFDE